MSRLLVLGLGGPDAEALVTAAVSRGHDVHALVVADRIPAEDDPVRALLRDCRPTDFAGRAIDQQVVAYARRCGVDGICTVNEYLTPLVARSCAEIGLPGNDPALADGPRNKILMAERFATNGVSAPRSHVAATERELLQIVASRFRLPVVVKPAANAGSNGVSVVTDTAALPGAFHRAREQGGQPAPLNLRLDPRVLVQEYIGGQEYSIESVTQKGISHHLCITRKVTTEGAHRVEIGHSLPTRLDSEAEQRILAETTRALAALGITDSVSHTEVKVTPDGDCRVIEVAARIGAGRIGVLVELALGISMPRATVDLALGIPVTVRPTRTGQAVSRLFTAPAAGRLTAVNGLPATGGQVVLVQVTRPVGSTVAGPESNGGRVGHFVVIGDDDEATNTRADELLARVEVEVETRTGSGATVGSA